MTVFDTRNTPDLIRQLERRDGLLVACYCAAWCDTCGDYQPEFTELSAKWPQHTFVWIDIEDDPHLLDDYDIDDFPTILIQNARGNVFFGEQLPYISHLDRLIKSAQANDMPITERGPRALLSLLGTP